MEVVYPRCCGLDVHKQPVVACVVVSGPEGASQKEVRSFGTMTTTCWPWPTGWPSRA